MSNRYRGETEVAVAGESLPLRFTLNALADVEDMVGLSPDQFLQERTFLKFSTIKAFYIAGRRDVEGKQFKNEQGEDEFGKIDPDFDTLVNQLYLAVLGSIRGKVISDEEVEGKTGQKKRKRTVDGTGTSSSKQPPPPA